ncbi:hypothetical protein EXIGLDRAFT_631691 [Exidia glandulosa HHB12029]|uniref:Chaperone/heat shock protein Hsp12 n=1 Tax=Exidia glandulosa HHB12029 TaxID=1314781 RepID=A0A165AZT9_EXIGL|nr:hypothetical protein EXIGLDRAFT_631691 [Exidia glandulosa HHB12029]
MSDTGRQSLTDKASAALKPDSQKTTTEHFGDKLSGKTDNHEKTTTQKVGDTFSGGHDATTNNNSSVLDKAKSALGLGDKST